MPAILRVQLVGFHDFERATLDSFFRVAEHRARRAEAAVGSQGVQYRGYTRATSDADADIAIVNAENPQAAAQAGAWQGKLLGVGGSQPLPGSFGHLGRPINVIALLKTLDEFAGREGPASSSASASPAPSGASAPVPPVVSSGLSSAAASAARPALAPVPVPAPAPRPLPQSVMPPAAAPSQFQDSRHSQWMDVQILVVDDSDIALRFMAKCLGRIGMHVELAESGEKALQLVAENDYRFVFMDVNMPGIDGYQTCKMIKKRPYPPGRRPPKVVMLTSRGGMVDKMRGTLAGCDAYLTKPLQQDELTRVMGLRLSSRPAGTPAGGLPSPAAGRG